MIEVQDCPICGCKDFSLAWAGPHLKAVCKACGETYRNYNSLVQYVTQNDTAFSEDEPKATEAQVKYLKSLIYRNGERLPKDIAGQMISVLKKAEGD